MQICLLSSLLHLLLPFFTFAATFSSYFSFIFITHQEPSYMCSESCYGHQQPNCQIPGPFPGCLFQALFNICYLHFEYTVLTTFLFPADLLFSLLPPSAYSLMLVKPDSNHHSLPLMAFRSSSCLPWALQISAPLCRIVPFSCPRWSLALTSLSSHKCISTFM